MATREVVTCDVCKKPIAAGALALGLYVEETKVPEPRGPKMTAGSFRRRHMTNRQCEIDVCVSPACVEALPSVLLRSMKRPMPRRRKHRR